MVQSRARRKVCSTIIIFKFVMQVFIFSGGKSADDGTVPMDETPAPDLLPSGVEKEPGINDKSFAEALARRPKLPIHEQYPKGDYPIGDCTEHVGDKNECVCCLIIICVTLGLYDCFSSLFLCTFRTKCVRFHS
jgi:hypothetical protein